MYLGYMLLAFTNIEEGVNRLQPNIKKIKSQLNKSPEILSEAIQCLLRKNGILNGYEIIRNLTQSTKYTNIDEFKKEIVENIPNITDNLRNEILQLNFNNYCGYLLKNSL